MRSMLCGVAAICLLGGLALSADTDACSFEYAWDLRFPAPDSQGVPLDVEFVLSGIGQDNAEARLTVEGTEESVPLVRRELAREEGFPTTILRPSALLRPNTRYALFLDGGVDYRATTRRFQTGASAASETLTAVTVSGVQALQAPQEDSCGSQSFACVGAALGTMVQVTVRRRCDNAITSEVIFGASEQRQVWYDAQFAQAPSCFEVRARDLAGRLGPVTRVCPPPQEVSARPANVTFTSALRCEAGRVVGDGQVIPYGDVPSNTENGSTCTGAAADGGVVTDVGFASPKDADGAGCSTRPTSSRVSWAALAVVAAVFVGRRRRVRCEGQVSS